ncbi:MAG: polysaccharide deacetylase, partial [Firmicutes bacterium]|nr:polysaccharide deacetylase [Bacillota bacterium]
RKNIFWEKIMTKRLLRIILPFILIFAMAQSAMAYTDGRWVTVTNYETRKDYNIDRGELSIYLVKLYEKLTGDIIKPGKNVFFDVNTNVNLYPLKAYYLGIMKAKDANIFEPQKSLTPGEFCEMAYRLVLRAYPEQMASPEEVKNISFYNRAVDFMVSRGIMDFELAVSMEPIHLGQAMEALDKIYENAPDFPVVLNTEDFDYTPLPALRAYLTFDDGVSTLTPKILDTLKEYNVPATFFITGYGDEAVIKRIADEGHAIGNHSFSHKYSYLYSGVDAFWEDMLKEEQYLENIIGYKPRMIRFPGGSDGGIVSEAVKREIIADVVDKGYVYFDWNVSAQDATGVKYNASQIASFVIRGTTGKKDAVILMHQLASKVSTYEALPEIITTLEDMGYTFMKLNVNSYAPHFW